MNAWDSDGLLRHFRRHPDTDGSWLYREEWPFRGIWEIVGATPLSGATPYIFGRHTLTAAENWTQPAGIALMLWIGWQRRGWLRRHAQRVDRRLWHRAAPGA